ncbi:MAG: hypothetical protein Q8K75_10880 [Chlamydiales bacterium]|nr:hypothetical protein [Chlamydiales bacterium]
MKSDSRETRKIALSLLLGGIIGVGIGYCMRTHSPPAVNKIGRTVSELGETLQSKNPREVMGTIEQKLPNSAAVFNSLSDWINTGIELWKSQNKG